MVKMKDDALDRIADALEKKYGVQPYVDVSGVMFRYFTLTVTRFRPHQYMRVNLRGN